MKKRVEFQLSMLSGNTLVWASTVGKFTLNKLYINKTISIFINIPSYIANLKFQ